MATLDEIRGGLVGLADRAEQHAPDPVRAAEEIAAAAERRSDARVWMLTAAAVVVFVVVAAGVFAALTPGDEDSTRVVTEPTSTLVDEQPDVTGPGPPGPTDSGLTVGAPIAVGGGHYVKESGGWVWMSNRTEPEILTRLDPDTYEVVARIDLGLPFTDLATDGASIWTLHGEAGQVSRVDASTDEVVWTAPVGATGGGIAYGARSVWVANSEADTVTRLDAGTGVVEAVVSVGDRPFTIEVIDQSAWVAAVGEGAVYRIDTTDGSVGRVPDVRVLGGLDADHGSVWVSDQFTGDAVRIDPDTLEVAARVPVPGSAFTPNIGLRSAWFAALENCGDTEVCIVRLVRIDRDTDEVVDAIEVDLVGLPEATFVTENAVILADTEGAPVPVYVDGGT